MNAATWFEDMPVIGAMEWDPAAVRSAGRFELFEPRPFPFNFRLAHKAHGAVLLEIAHYVPHRRLTAKPDNTV